MPAVSIAPSFHPKVWGSRGLNPWFPIPEEKTGEVWFEAGGQLPLIKFLFTTDRLSVQVHPDDLYAQANGGGSGKTEMWHILRAAPGAQVALGFRRPITPQILLESAQNGTVETLLNWITVRPGDTLFVPAGTVHAIGAGLVLCEIQQHSDVTFRLYDYGRPRELHLDQALEVASLSTCLGRATLPVRCPFFHTERVAVSGEGRLEPVGRPSAIIVLEGEGALDGAPVQPGEVWEIPPGTPARLNGGLVLLRTYIP